MKQLAVLALLSPLCLAAAGAAAPTIVGTWDLNATDARGAQTQWKLTIREVAGRLAADLDGEIHAALEQPRFEAGLFTCQLRINPTELVKISLKLDGDRLDGRFEGQDSGAGTIKGARVAAANVSGTWTGEWEVSPDGGPGPHYMVLKQAGETITGSVGPSQQQQIAIDHAKLAAGHLTFDLVIPSGNGIGLSFDFTVNGDSMTGKALLKMNGTERPLKLSVNRAK